ncbi:MAG TPA: glycosyltransferase family 87 protein [Gammaproteobacteria bacterium]|nr:glycosyltransferase family 87 protein [Gammaproteobacteria bacterium]
MSLKRIGLLFFSALMLFVTVVISFKRVLVSGNYFGASDFWKFYNSVLFYFSGQNIYTNAFVVNKASSMASIWGQADGNLNPPFFTLLLLPLHYFNYSRAFQIWNMISVVCMFLGAYLALRPFPQWHKNTLPIMALFALYLPTADNIACGQMASILLVILASVWLLARKNQDISAGLLLGFACAIKLFCGLFLIYFLCLKRVRIVIAALSVFILAFLMAGFVFGFSAYREYYAVLGEVHWYASTWNASFYGFFTRIFSNTEGNVSLLNLPYLANGLTVICSVALFSYLIRFWRKQSPQQFDLGFSLVIVAMLLLSPLGWIYYFPVLLIPYLILVGEGNMGTHLAACLLLLLSTQMWGLLIPLQIKTMKELLIMGGMGFVVLLGLLGLLSVVAKGVRHDENLTVSENSWILIYSVIFIPSLLYLEGLAKSLYLLCH